MTVREMVLDPAGPRDPAAACDRCGARGTIARAARFGATPDDPPIVRRFCDGCWPAARAELRAGDARAFADWRARFHAAPMEAPAPPDGWHTESQSWHDTEEFVATLEADLASGTADLGDLDLGALAAAIARSAPERDGAPPPGVVAFLRRYGPPGV